MLPVGDASTTPAESIGSMDPSFQVSDDWLSIAPALRVSRSGAEGIFTSVLRGEDPNGDAGELGISQMHVSRLVSPIAGEAPSAR